METKERKRVEYVATLPCGCVVMWAAVGTPGDLADLAKSAAATERKMKREVVIAPLTVPLQTLRLHGRPNNPCTDCVEQKPARKPRAPRPPKRTEPARDGN